jgi:hypothetical protein
MSKNICGERIIGILPSSGLLNKALQRIPNKRHEKRILSVNIMTGPKNSNSRKEFQEL